MTADALSIVDNKAVIGHEAVPYLTKGFDAFTERINSFLTVAAGDAYLQPSVTRHLIDRLIVMDRSPQKLLTARELEILEWMASTATYREIARQLSISDETVRSHAKHILSKLGQSNRASAVKEAEKLELLRAK